MKWYNSVKIKLIGFFIFVSMLFLVSLIITFFVMRERTLGENAAKEATLMTSKILEVIKTKQVKAEESVLSLASISSLFEKRLLDESQIIPTLLMAHRSNNLDIISGGIWFEPFVIPKRENESSLFFSMTKNNQLKLIKAYAKKVNYRHMPFYRLGKKTKEKETSWMEVYTDPVTKIRMITVVSPIYKNQNFIGVASIDLAIGHDILEFMGKEKLIHPSRYLMMVDKKGNFIVKSDLINRFTDASNLFKVKNDALKHILHDIKPSLDSGGYQTEGQTSDDVTYIKPIYYSQEKDEKSVLDDTYHIKDAICIVEDDPILHTDSIIAIYHFPRTHWNVIIGIPKEQVLARQNELFFNVLIIVILLTLLTTILGYIILQKIFVKPISDINKQLRSAISENTLLECHDRGEIGMLVENLNARTIKLARSRARESKEHQLRLAHEEMLMQQSKMAVMGEMMDSVAHQWKQPLNALTLYSELIRNDFEEGNVDQAYVEEFRKNIQVQIDHMVNTLDEFRSFFRPNKEKKSFKMIDVVNSALFLAKDDILKNRILVKIEQEDDIEVNGYENEFKHLILNIINNAKDAFIENDIQQRLIRIRLISDKKGDRLEICDNAGGVPETVIEKIFEANVTTKEEGKGTGIGLYMSRKIAEKHHATLSVENRKEGACFIVTFSKESQEETATPAK